MSKMVFRRIGGRIVPIGMSREDKAKTVGAVAGGVGAAAVSGNIAGKLLIKSVAASKKARVHITQAKNFEKIAGYKLSSNIRADKFRMKSSSFKTQARTVKGAGHLISSSLFGYAADKAITHTKIGENSGVRGAVDTSAAFAGATLTDAVIKGKTKGLKSAAKFVLKHTKNALRFGIKSRFHI